MMLIYAHLFKKPDRFKVTNENVYQGETHQLTEKIDYVYSLWDKLELKKCLALSV